MQVKIVNPAGETHIMNSNHIFNNWNVKPAWEGELYRWYFESDPESLQAAENFIFKDRYSLRSFEFHIIDDKGNESDNLIPMTDDKYIWINYNPDNDAPWLYLEIRTNFEGDGYGGEED